MKIEIRRSGSHKEVGTWDAGIISNLSITARNEMDAIRAKRVYRVLTVVVSCSKNLLFHMSQSFYLASSICNEKQHKPKRI